MTSGFNFGYCIVDSDGILSCGRYPGFCAANPSARVVAPGTTRFTEVVSSCAVAESGRLWCFTRAADGSSRDVQRGRRDVPGVAWPRSSGSSSTSGAYCGFSPTGQGWCWGATPATISSTPRPHRIPRFRRRPSPPQPAVRAHSPRLRHRLWPHCRKGSVWCWARNDAARVGPALAGRQHAPYRRQFGGAVPRRPRPRRLPLHRGLRRRVAGRCLVLGEGWRFSDGAVVALMGPTPGALAGFGNVRDIIDEPER